MRNVFVHCFAALALTGAMLASNASACPLCQEVAIESAAAEGKDDPFQEARAYNSSIYFMVVMPYLLFGAISALVYRGYRQSLRDAQERALQRTEADCIRVD